MADEHFECLPEVGRFGTVCVQQGTRRILIPRLENSKALFHAEDDPLLAECPDGSVVSVGRAGGVRFKRTMIPAQRIPAQRIVDPPTLPWIRCPKCGSTNIEIGACVLGCLDCGWRKIGENPCAVCGEPATGCVGVNGKLQYFCDAHPNELARRLHGVREL